MKKLTTALVLCLVVALAAPAMAVDVTFDGHLRSRGFLYSGPSFSDQADAQDAKYDSRFRLNFKIAPTEDVFVRGRVQRSYNWSITTRAPSLDLDRAWITWRSPVGSLEVGRMSGGSWGNVWGDAEDAFDRIKLTTPVGDKMAVIAIIQKSVENDYAATPNVSDGDADAYYLAVNYAAETFSTGLLTAWARNATLSDNSLAPNNFIEDRFYLVPYVKAALADGKVNILCDLQYEFGTREFLSAGASDADISAFSGMLEVNGAVGKFGWEVGYGYMGGQDVNDDKITAANMAYKGVGLDWDKFVYFSDTAGVGLLNDAWYTGTPGGAVNVQNGGVSTWWLGGSFAVKENLKLSLLFGQAMALETDSNWADDNYGSELDFKLGWNITENLDYNFNFGYVMAGDAAASIQGITTSELEDQYKIYHKLQLNF